MESGSALVVGPGGSLPVPASKIEKFGRYYLLDRIAVGGMAEVYRAVTHGVQGFRRTFVVKRILADKAMSPTFIRMFCDEARISALLHHPNIVQVYDFGHVDGSYFLAMEYLLGKDLSSVMRVLRAAKTAMPPGLAAFIVREAAVGLHHAHTLRNAAGQTLGIVHRDVTPSNIMLVYAGGVKVLDFGIAKASNAVRVTDSDSGNAGVKGKFGYLAPEQARSEDVDRRADIFALGVTLWEMLTGRRLFVGKNQFDTLRNVLQRPVVPPSSLRPGIPPELDRVVLRALERDRARRYQTAEEMAVDLHQILRDLRQDGQSLKTFLNDLFADESSSLSLEAPELPEEVLRAAAMAPRPGWSSNGVPRDDQSLEIEIIEPSGPVGRARNPAPPFGVIASEGIPARPRPRGARFRRLAFMAAGVAVVAGCVAVGLGLHAASPPMIAPRATVLAASPKGPASAFLPQPAGPTPEPAPQAPTARIDLDSTPTGAGVLDQAGRSLGTTPLSIKMPRSLDRVTLTVVKAGFRPASYEMTPDHDAIVRVQLARAARNRGGRAPRAGDLADGLTLNPF
jgi:serine/threonine protein kinase